MKQSVKSFMLLWLVVSFFPLLMMGSLVGDTYVDHVFDSENRYVQQTFVIEWSDFFSALMVYIIMTLMAVFYVFIEDSPREKNTKIA